MSGVKLEHKLTPVIDIKKGDEIANLGVVAHEPQRVGVFLVLSVRGTIWSLGCGRGDIATWDVVRHESERLVVTNYEET